MTYPSLSQIAILMNIGTHKAPIGATVMTIVVEHAIVVLITGVQANLAVELEGFYLACFRSTDDAYKDLSTPHQVRMGWPVHTCLR